MDEKDSLPMLPGFRQMALRRMSEDRRRLVAELAAQRQAAGLSQTEVAARMGTSQSAVARLESGAADVRASTLERYAAALGSHISWRLRVGEADRVDQARPAPAISPVAQPSAQTPASAERAGAYPAADHVDWWRESP